MPSDLHLAPPRVPRRIPFKSSILIMLAALAAAGVLIVLLAHREPDSRDVGRKCVDALFSDPMNVEEALFQLSEYRRLLKDKIPPRVNEILLGISSIDAYKLASQPSDESTFFNVATFDRITQTFQDPQSARLAMGAFAYVCRNFQSDIQREKDLPPVPIYPLLVRGHGGSTESAWVMASLIRFCRDVVAVIVQLPAEGNDPPYSLCGVILDGRMYLFDPYRGVPLCRASDGCVADLESLLSGKETLAAGYGGQGTPVTVDALRKAKYMIPVDPSEITADAWLIDEMVYDSGRNESVYHDAQVELVTVARAVFGKDAKYEQNNSVQINCPGRSEVVMIWGLPFQIANWTQTIPEYQQRVLAAEKQNILPGRDLQLLGKKEAALKAFDFTISNAPVNSPEAENAAFFRCRLLATPQERSDALNNYLKKYPKGRWVPLATMLLADAELKLGRKDRAIELADHFPPPYEHRGRILADILRKGGDGIPWRYPDPPANNNN